MKDIEEGCRRAYHKIMETTQESDDRFAITLTIVVVRNNTRLQISKTDERAVSDETGVVLDTGVVDSYSKFPNFYLQSFTGNKDIRPTDPKPPTGSETKLVTKPAQYTVAFNNCASITNIKQIQDIVGYKSQVYVRC